MQRRPSLTEGKLLIMRSLKVMEPLDENQLAEFFASMDLLTFFEVKEALAELLENELVSLIRGDLAPEAYILTPKGRDTYAMFAQSIPLPLRDRVDNLLPEWRRKFRRQEQIRTRFFKSGEGDYCAALEIYEHGRVAMELNMHLPDIGQAKQVADALNRSAEVLYRQAWSALDAPDINK